MGSEKRVCNDMQHPSSSADAPVLLVSFPSLPIPRSPKQLTVTYGEIRTFCNDAVADKLQECRCPDED